MNSLFIKIIFLLSFLIIPYSFESNNSNSEEFVKNTLKNFNSKIPITKIYLHTDRINYLAGENLYFKAYVLNFHKLSFDSINTNLYFELIDPFKNVVFTKRFLIKNGISIGSVALPDTLIEGLYQVRAYTNFMRNFDVKYFFSQNIYIDNLSNKFSSYSLKLYKKFHNEYKKNKDEFYVKVFQENVILENQKINKITVLTKNYFNEPIITNIKILNKNKIEILENNTNNLGICTFYLKSSNDKFYILTSYNSKTKLTPIKFYQSDKPFFIINDIDKENLLIKVFNFSNYQSDKFNFLIHSNGEVFFYKSFNTKDSCIIKINQEILIPGLYTFSLFSENFTLLYEKLYVNIDSFKNNKLIKVNLSNDDNNTERTLYISAKIDDPSLFYNLSVSINTDEEVYRNLNIYNYLLYGCDLGINNNESIIFSSYDKKFINNDYLNIFKWDRFLWNDLFNNSLSNIYHKIEKGLTIEGKITSELFSIPLKNCIVKLYILNSYNDIYTTITDENGKFIFENLYYYDDIDIKIEAFRPNQKRNLVIVLPDKPIHDVINFNPEPIAYKFYKEIDKKNIITSSKINNELQEQENKNKEKDKNRIEGIYGTPDFVITSDQIPQGYSNVLQVIQGRVPGIDVSGNNVIIRGVKTIYGSTDPLYLLDGVPVNDVNAILSIPVQDVDRIEIIKGPTSAIYGSRGANGIIAIYTKRGEFLKKGIVELKIQGFSRDIKFKQNVISYDFPYTLYWEPDITLNYINNEYIIKFKLPKNTIKYNISIQGITNNGLPISYSFLAE